ncbi:acetyl-CoA synthetase-like protein, partial [Setomelanomma holmii]
MLQEHCSTGPVPGTKRRPRLAPLTSITVCDVSNLSKNVPTSHEVKITAADPAAILFTSGSTGIPKGVVLSHGGLCNHLEALTVTHGFGAEVVLQQSSIGFDMSHNQIFMTLANGGTLVIVPESLRKDLPAIARIMLEQNVTYTSATPSEYLAWLRYGSESLFQSKSWNYATAGGEQFTPELLHGFQLIRDHSQHRFRVFNAYRPTECSMSSNEFEIILDGADDQQLTAGQALPNYATYILDSDLNTLPVGYPGEICIAGAGVAIGYLENTKETNKKFSKDPQSSSSAIKKGWNRLYRTGDKGVLRSDGTLQVIGRIEGDTQQSMLAASQGQLREVIVTPRGDPTILVAHAILSSDISNGGEQRFLQSLAASLPLPQYMRPSIIIPIDHMPLTASGKTRDVYTIDGNSDFFHVGGNSMLLIELRELVKKRFQVQLPLLRLFENSTLSAMAAAIQDLSSEDDSEIEWNLETDIPANYRQLSLNPTPTRSHTSGKTIVFTGATGFLGNHILRLLMDNPAVDKIHCIAVRDSGKLQEFAQSEKVVIHSGNLMLSRGGLLEAEASTIFNSADAIIHNPADVSFLKT